MTAVPLGVGAYNREYAQEPEIQLQNRFFEKNPTNQVDAVGLLSRPGSTFFVGAGTGPIRTEKHQPGVFDGDLFFVSDDQLYRYDGENAPVNVTGIVQGDGVPAITFVAGAGYEHLFIADGHTLQFYDGTTSATGTLTVSGGSIVATDVVQIDAAYYEWTAGSVDAGTPMGTVGDPYLVDIGASDTDALANLIKALNLTGVAGTDYSTNTQINVNVGGTASDATTMDVTARASGSGGNSIPTTETGANIAWGAATLEGGGIDSLQGVVTPDDVAMISLATLASFVLAVVVQSQRFYWVQPGATTIDALDFAEAESEPDQVIEVLRVGDSVYFFGQSSTEVWYASGEADAPFIRQQGLAFSQGMIEGTAVGIRTQVILVAEDGVVYSIVGGPTRLSNNSIEEKIRLALVAEQEGS